jgi:hypothetical protein
MGNEKSMENLQKACDRFKEAHEDFLGPNSGYATGYGLDPARKGPNGILIYAMSNDVRQQDDLIRSARETLPPSWEGFPVYFKGMSIPVARPTRR